MPKTIEIRFYEELNDFLPRKRSKVTFQHNYNGNMSIKDVIESLGIPHTEIDLILVNGKSVDFSYKTENNDLVSVYPVFESLDISNVTKLRPKPLRTTNFVLDVHLGKLARYLRMLGFDTLYENNYSDPQIIDISIKENRIILTRDIGILKNGSVTHAYWIRSQKPKEQLQEVINRFNLSGSYKPFNRCIDCNGHIQVVEKDKVLDKLKPKTRKYFNKFYQCTTCKKVYWEGSHYHRMVKRINTLQNTK